MSGSRSTGGREFQDDGLDDENARGPRVTVCVRGTYSILCEEHDQQIISTEHNTGHSNSA